MSSKPVDTESLKKIAAEANAPLPGTPGGKLVGYAEAQRLQNPEPPPSHVITDTELAESEFERAAGKPVEEMTEQDFYKTGITFRAKDLTLMTDLHVVLKDKSMEPRWFNYKAGNGRSVQQGYMRGFRAVTKEDTEFTHAKTTDENGALVMGDLVCLMIPKVILFGGYYKDSMEKAKARVNRAMTAQGANKNLQESGQPGFSGDYYVPDIAQATRADASEARRLVYEK
jgi:hypothetical protein